MRLTIKIEHLDLRTKKITLTKVLTTEKVGMDLYEMIEALEESLEAAGYNIGDMKLDLVNPGEYTGPQ
jgi:hypothetical protein